MSGEVDVASCKLTLTNFAVASSICDGDPGDTGGGTIVDVEEEMSVLIDGSAVVVVVVVVVVVADPGGGKTGGVGKGPGPDDDSAPPATTAPTALLPTSSPSSVPTSFSGSLSVSFLVLPPHPKRPNTPVELVCMNDKAPGKYDNRGLYQLVCIK